MNKVNDIAAHTEDQNAKNSDPNNTRSCCENCFQKMLKNKDITLGIMWLILFFGFCFPKFGTGIALLLAWLVFQVPAFRWNF